VDPGAHVELEARKLRDDRECGSNGARGAIESGKKTVARSIDLPPAVACEHKSNGLVVFLEKLAPAQVAELRDAFSRADEIREEDRQENAVGLADRPNAGDECRYLVHDCVLVAKPRPGNCGREQP
jgi:hypothetical protein